MKAFRSKLAVLLTIRQKEEQAKLEVYGRAMQARQAAAEVRRVAQRGVEALEVETRNAMRSGCTAATLSQYQGFGLRLALELARASERLAIAEKSLSRALDDLQLARRKRETVEKFQAKERTVYDQELQVEEQKLLDEMALRRVAANLACSPVDA